jgi:brefeldin A-resistance guanine nucleotide exchange factor 1
LVVWRLTEIDIHETTPLVILNPFLALVRSPLTSGPITSLALAALNSIVVNILPVYLAPVQLDVKPSTPLQIALAHLTSALSQCRFPSSSPQQDELVLLRLLRVIDSILLPLPMPNSSNYGSMLDQMADESVCELLEVGLGMLARARLGEGLRTAAQSCVQGIVRSCFARLKTLTKDDVDRLLASGKKSGNSTEPTVNLEASKPATEEQGDTEKAQEQEKSQDPAPTTADGGKKSLESQISVVDEEQPPPSFTPHGLPTILELLRVLIALLNPSDQAHTDSMRLCALAILNTALEVGGVTLGKWPELREGLRDEGCRYLFQVSQVEIISMMNADNTAHKIRLSRPTVFIATYDIHSIRDSSPAPQAPIRALLVICH